MIKAYLKNAPAALPKPVQARNLSWLSHWLCTAAIALGCNDSAFAQSADFLRGMPSAAEVMKRFSDGGDPIQSLGRQCAALDMLERAFFRSHDGMTKAVESNPATLAVRQDYAAGFKQLRARYEAAAAPMDDAKRQRWTRMCERGGQGVLAQPVTRDEVWAMLSPSVTTAYDQLRRSGDQRMSDRQLAQRQNAEKAAQGAARESERRRQAESRALQRRLTGLAIGGGILALSIFLAVTGFRGVRRLNRYEFENRTDGGVVQFESYDASIRHTRRQMLYSVIAQAGLFGALAGIITIVAMWF